MFGIYAGSGPEEANGLLMLILDELEKAGDAISNEELNRARAQLKSSILMSLESTSSRCERLARHLMVYGRNLSLDEIVEKTAGRSGVARRRRTRFREAGARRCSTCGRAPRAIGRR